MDNQTEVQAENQSVQEAPKKQGKGDVAIIVFLAVMALLVIGAIGFVIYLTMGPASGCNCAECRG